MRVSDALRYVYFLRPIGMDGPIKIGMSSWPQLRAHEYGKHSPFPLELVAVFPGDSQMERLFHCAFLEFHTHHEWFSANEKLTATIAAINNGSFDPSDLPKTGFSLNYKNYQERKRSTAAGKLLVEAQGGAL